MDEVDDMDGKWTMDNGRWTMRAMIGIIAIIASICFGQIETHIIDLADPDTYLSDETVYIKRDTSGYLVFADSASGGEKTLAELINSASPGAHSGLTGLSGDDHPQYYTSTRLYSKLGSSNVGTGATYVNSLPISGDVGSNATIGAHVADGAIHGKPGHRATVDTVTGQYSTIASAIAALATTGGVVDVSPGTYSERIELVKDVQIVAAPGVVLSYGDVYPPAVKVPTGATGCAIRGLTIRSTNTSSGYALVEVLSGADLTLENCDIDGDSSYSNLNTLSVAGTCYVRNSRIWSQRKPVYVTGTCEIEQSRIWATETSSTDPTVYSEGYLWLRNCWIDSGGGQYGVHVANGETRIWGTVFQRVTEDIYRTGGMAYLADSVYEAQTGTVTNENEGYKKFREVSVDRTSRGTSNPIEYRLSGEGTLFSVDGYGNVYAAGTITGDDINYEEGEWVLSCTSDSPSGLLGVTEIAGTGGTYQPGDEIYYRLYSYRTFDGEKICSADYIERLAGPVVGTDAYIKLDWAAVDGVDGYRVVSFKTGDTDGYITDLEGGDTVSWDDFGSHFVPVLWDLQPFESEGVTTTTINSADGVYGVHTNKDIYGRAYYGSETRWKDWAAVAACGAAVVWDGNRGRNVGWSPGYGDETGCYFYNYLLSDDDGQRVYFPIPYEAGTILTRLRVKWCANAQDNGIKVRLVKRDESACNNAWTVVGAQQSYIDSAGDINININTYDFADETTQANHSYTIEVESVVDNPVGVRLYSFGIETSKRVY